MSLFDDLDDLPITAKYARLMRASPDLAPFLIHNFAAVPAIMQALGGETNSATLAQMAGDPNTSVDALVYLAGCFPSIFCANPIFPLLLFERPGLPYDMEPTSLGRLLAYPGLPSDFVGAVATYGQPDLAAAARLHIGLAGEASSDWREELPGALTGISSIPEDDLLTALITLGLVPTWMHERLACGAGPALLHALGRGEAPEERQAVARALPLSARARRAADPTRPLEELVVLIEDEAAEVRAALAANPVLGPGELLRLKHFEDWAENEPIVYETLAANPRSPAEVLREIAQDRIALNTAARREVARNPATPTDVLMLLADEQHAADIRIILARHPNLGPQQRTMMVASSLEAAISSGHPIYRAIGLAHPDVPAEVSELALRSPHWVERLALALGPTTSPAALNELSGDGNRLVRAAAQERASS